MRDPFVFPHNELAGWHSPLTLCHTPVLFHRPPSPHYWLYGIRESLSADEREELFLTRETNIMRILRKRGETIFTCGKLRGRDGYSDGNDNVFIMENCLNLVYNKILFGCLHNLQYIPRIQYQKCGGWWCRVDGGEWEDGRMVDVGGYRCLIIIREIGTALTGSRHQKCIPNEFVSRRCVRRSYPSILFNPKMATIIINWIMLDVRNQL